MKPEDRFAHGIDPGAVRKAQKQAETEETETFEVIACEWHTKFTPTWTPGHATTIKSRLERDLFPWIGKRPISEIKAPELLAVLRRVESRGALESAHRIRTIAGQVFRYAVATGRAERDPSGDLKGALPKPGEKHHAAITDPMEILTELKELTGVSKYVFPSGRSFSRPMSDNAVLAALRRMGYDKDTMTGHGFRAMARTILDEVPQVRQDFVEHQLAHAVKDPNGRAYNRTAHLEERRMMMQKWADYLDGLKQGAKVSPMAGKA